MKACTTLVVLVLLATGTLAQDLDRDAQILRRRRRDRMHPDANPMVIVGREDGENGFRESVPVLAQGTLTPRSVDHDELYAARMALYASPATPREGSRGASPEAMQPKASTRSEQPEETEGGGHTWQVGLVLAAIAALLWSRR